MKKRLEAELISIAHRVLKLKNKSDVDQLYTETKKLYETLTILKFYGDNYETIKNEIPQEEIEEKITVLLDKEIEKTVEENTVIEITQAVVEAVEQIEEEVIASYSIPENEEILVKENVDAVFEFASEQLKENVEKIEAIQEKSEPKQISFDELLGENYTEPVFVKPTEIYKNEEIVTTETALFGNKKEEKTLSLNDKLAKGINIGLNDRIAFVKHLFGESNEDYNRVLSQLNTFNLLSEALTFIDEIVKPDYNNWAGKDEYAARFIEIVAKKFN